MIVKSFFVTANQKGLTFMQCKTLQAKCVPLGNM